MPGQSGEHTRHLSNSRTDTLRARTDDERAETKAFHDSLSTFILHHKRQAHKRSRVHAQVVPSPPSPLCSSLQAGAAAIDSSPSSPHAQDQPRGSIILRKPGPPTDLATAV